MPSAARQKLPADLWRQGQRKYTSVNSSSLFQNQDMQANPGQFDVIEEKLRPSNHRIPHKSQKRPFNGRGSPRALPRGGSTDTLSSLSDSESNVSHCNIDFLSRSAESDSSLSSNSSRICNAYAMESSIAPHPSQLPLPPLEWLQSTLIPSSPIVGSVVSIQGLLSCQVAA
ncbi:hypothetical protein Bpfe_018570 [Biomphalaria pfeifferi]|uniref:Uncharacterized protein n=1 Tax=Biomphalaria pfeifferi TaxID=112525 RepID=A0AAD8F636_BIOPF|nr:hypothetical protein Bpfe_018570 [Biomphalaria pfeifferi]